MTSKYRLTKGFLKRGLYNVLSFVNIKFKESLWCGVWLLGLLRWLCWCMA